MAVQQVVKQTPTRGDTRQAGNEPEARARVVEGPAPARGQASHPPLPPKRLNFRSSMPVRPSTMAPSPLPTLAPAQAELMASLARLRARFRDVAAVVEGLGALRSLGGEEALIEMAMFAQSHEQTVELAWRALADCEQAARLACGALVPSQRAPSEPGAAPSTDPAPALPSSAAPAGDEEAEGPVTQVDAGPSRVLVVDDDPTVLRAFRRVLSADHEIVTARDGAEALRVVLGGKRVDAIICDIGMPKLDGPTFFSELFELRPQMMPRVVFCTGGMPNEKTQRFLDRLQAPLLFKPVAAADLRSAIDYVRSR